MGPSVKFVLAIIDSISKKNRGNFFLSVKRPYRGVGGGPRGGLAKDHKKYGFFFRNPSLTKNPAQHHADVTTSLHSDLHISAMVKATVTIIIREISNLKIAHCYVLLLFYYICLALLGEPSKFFFGKSWAFGPTRGGGSDRSPSFC